MKYIYVFLSTLLLFSAPVIALAAEEETAEVPVSAKQKLKAMAAFVDKQARGFKAVLDKDMDAAEDSFEDAGEIAADSDNWEGTLEAGYSLSTIGKTETAKKLFDVAKQITAKAEDWRSMLAVGYAYASLPEDENAVEDATEAMEAAGDIAESQNNWRALLEIGKGLNQIDAASLAKTSFDKAKGILGSLEKEAIEEKNWWSLIEVGRGYCEAQATEMAQKAYEKALAFLEHAEYQPSDEQNWTALVEIGSGFAELKSAKLAKATYQKALDLVEEVRDSEGLEMIARGYEEIGETEKAAEVTELAETVKKEELAMGGGKKIRRKKVHKEPPDGWSPTGETLAKPPKISDTSREILAGKAREKQIEAHEKYLAGLDAEKEYTYEFKRYYYGDDSFGYRRWDVKGDFNMNGWAENQLGRYKLVNGIYVLDE